MLTLINRMSSSILNWFTPYHQLIPNNLLFPIDPKVFGCTCFIAQGEIGKVCRLRKFLYSLKQSPRAWFGKFSHAIETFGMQKSKSDHCVFYKNSSFCIILLVVYVDNIVITRSDSKGILSLKSFFHS